MRSKLTTLRWRNGILYLLDQRSLPLRKKFVRCRTYADVAKAIKEMTVRGAPAIGVAAAYGLALAAKSSRRYGKAKQLEVVRKAARVLASTRPTAVNLFWGIERVMKKIEEAAGGNESLYKVALNEANKMFNEDIEANRRLGRYGASLLPERCIVMTYCNAGALATVGYGTALGVIRAAVEDKKRVTVLVPETRPKLQGSRLTAYELEVEGIDYRVITDNMAAFVMSKGMVDYVIVGADRVLARTGHAINKIGTLNLAVLAKHFNIPFYVAAPLSSFDFKSDVEEVVIEERSEEEVLSVNGRPISPKNARALNPAFDITPPELITAVITEFGIYSPKELISLSERQ
ncbi:MAG: S-methyl-5-thioribose-1-phosphate isomerase [Aigarchaeota archaeon]|nr:S-methyl-5-thioribose-1-phosphate isomerase [Aigarchaeota archaeon]MDW8092546.1 S-methyl-5-thioribose-1-phosphate isomerase [Nitrososphaerota archaeon]